MPHFKNSNNELYWLDEGDDPSAWIPADCVQITDSEANEIREQHSQPLDYAQKRAAEYPPIADYIDGVVKSDKTQIEAYIATCLAVKAKYPKP